MRNIYWVFLIVILLLGCYFWSKSNIQEIYTTEIIIDTFYVERVVRDTIPKLIYIKEKVTIIDTLMSVDSIYIPVYVPIEQSKYNNTLVRENDTISYNAYVSGYKAKLDSIDIKVKYPMIETTKFVKSKEKWSDRFSVGVGVYGGYGLINKKPDIFIGVGINYKIK